MSGDPNMMGQGHSYLSHNGMPSLGAGQMDAGAMLGPSAGGYAGNSINASMTGGGALGGGGLASPAGLGTPGALSHGGQGMYSSHLDLPSYGQPDALPSLPEHAQAPTEMLANIANNL